MARYLEVGTPEPPARRFRHVPPVVQLRRAVVPGELGPSRRRPSRESTGEARPSSSRAASPIDRSADAAGSLGRREDAAPS